MGFNNPDVPWSEIERQLSDLGGNTPAGRSAGSGRSGRSSPGHPGDGSDSPAWSHHRQPYVAPPELTPEFTVVRRRGEVPYAELHCHTNFSFLDGASHPEELVEEAARLGLEALAICDHNGFYGVVRFAEAAREVGMPTVFGAELTIGPEGGDRPTVGRSTDDLARTGGADPAGRHLVVLARDPTGYAALAQAISTAQMAGRKDLPRLDAGGVADLAERARPPGGADRMS